MTMFCIYTSCNLTFVEEEEKTIPDNQKILSAVSEWFILYISKIHVT